MPYDPYLVQPMRDELTRLGFIETHREEQAGFRRVFMEKRIAREAK